MSTSGASGGPAKAPSSSGGGCLVVGLGGLLLVLGPVMASEVSDALSFLPLIGVLMIAGGIGRMRTRAKNATRTAQLAQQQRPGPAVQQPPPSEPAPAPGQVGQAGQQFHVGTPPQRPAYQVPSPPAPAAGPVGPAGPPSPPPSSTAPPEAQRPEPAGEPGEPADDDPALKLPAHLRERVVELRATGRTIEAVNLIRDETGMELYEASQLVLAIER